MTVKQKQRADRNARLWRFWQSHRHSHSKADVARIFHLSPRLAVYWINRMESQRTQVSTDTVQE